MEIRSVTKAIRLLDMLGGGNGHYGVSELARLVEMDKSSVSRMLRTLEQAGYVAQDPITQRYSLGLTLGVLGYKALRRLDLRGTSRPMVERLAQLTNECAHLAILADGRSFYVDQVMPPRVVGVDAPIGTLAPLHCTALGKALLAFQPEDVREDIFEKLFFEPYTQHTVGPKALREMLAQVRSSGVAFDNEEFSIGVRCMAAPVFRYDGTVVAAIGISGPSPRVTDTRIAEWQPKLLEVSRELSARLGWDGIETPVNDNSKRATSQPARAKVTNSSKSTKKVLA